MTPKQFSDATREYNKQYRALFGYIPSIRDFSCSQEEYIDALKKAIDQKRDICTLLTPYGDPLYINSEIWC